MTTQTKYIHLSNQLINLIHDVKPTKSNNTGLKPNGLWFSKNNEWKEFCESNNLWTYLYEYELDIDFDNFLILDTTKKLDDFVKKYYSPKTTCIKWNSVMKDYSGIYFDNFIAIRKYIMEKKKFTMDYIWFLGVDINSGCVFRQSSVKAFVQV